MIKKSICFIMVFVFVFSFSSTSGYGMYPESVKEIVIDIPTRNLYLLENNEIMKTYPVAVGKSHTQTPLGTFYVMNKAVNPYYAKHNIKGGSPYNPLGERWIGFKNHYGIHGNSNPDSIGTFASAGCVRMFERDVKELYKNIVESASVTIKYDLIKVMDDIDGEDTIVKVYKDYYSKRPNLKNEVIDKLKEINIYNDISQERLTQLKEMIRKRSVVFSKTWALFINEEYVTNDIIFENGITYINKNKMEKYFNIKMFDMAGENKSLFLGRKISNKVLNEKTYISLEEISQKISGEIIKDSDIQTIDYKLNYVRLNNSLIGGAYNLIEEPIVELLPLIREFDIEMKINNGNMEFIYDDVKLAYTMQNGEPYISVNELENRLNINNEIYTVNQSIELSIAPEIIYNNKLYESKIINGATYIPYEILEREVNKSITTEVTEITPDETEITPVINLQEIKDIYFIADKKYVNLNYINKIEEIKVIENLYRTIIYIK